MTLVTNSYPPELHKNSINSLDQHFLDGKVKEKSNHNVHQAVNDDISDQVCCNKSMLQTNNQIHQEEKFVIAESLHMDKKKIWKDKLSISEINTQTMKLLEILDQESTSNEKVLTPFWTQQSTEISKKLWLPTKIDCVDSVLSSCKESSKDIPMGVSWFSIKNKHLQTKNSLMTSFQLSQYSLPDSMDSAATQSKIKSNNKPLKTLKMRLFPTKSEQDQLQLCFDQFRWYYNTSLTVAYKHYGNKICTKQHMNNHVRDLIKKYKFVETLKDDKIVKDFVYDEELNEVPLPSWWKDNKPHSRLPRGATKKFVSSLNASIALHKAGYISKFQMKFRTKKSPTEYLSFEDKAYPAFIKKIKSHYWFRDKNHKRTKISLADITTQERGIEIIYDKATKKYFLHYPVEQDWFPSTDLRNDKQVMYHSKESRIISLDPGVRKFMVGYDPTGKSIFIGESANQELMKLLYKIDKTKGNTHLLWKRLKNLVNELHWKTISYLIRNYDVILLPEFKTSQMIRKGNKLTKMTKRLMNMYSFHEFKQKLKMKCEMYNKNLIIVDESFTSCTCGQCGHRNNTNGNETFHCRGCDQKMDRDVNGSRNILIKNITLR